MIKKLFLTLCVCLLLCLTCPAENFYIKNYNVDLKADNTKKVHVTETIDVFFTRDSHGIFRDIPAKNAEITNIKVSEKNKITQECNSYSIKIGSPDKYVKGEHTYKISYDYIFFDNKNEFYFNVIGTDWQTNIDKVSFNLEMPAPFDEAKTGISVGTHGTEGFSEGEGIYTVKDKNVTFKTLRALEPREGVTIRIEVPQGYFIKNRASKQNVSLYLILLSTLACIIIWFIYGKDEKPTPVVSFTPPANSDILEIQLIYNEAANTRGIIGMIVDLAQRGYLKITNNKDGFVIEKGREYNESDEYEKKLINAIFNGVKQTATENHLKKSGTFYKTIEKLIDDKNKEKNKLYEPEEYNKQIKKIMQYIIGLLLSVLAFVCASFNPLDIFKGLLIAGLYIIAQWFIYLCVDELKHNTLAAILTNLILILPFYTGFLVTFDVMDYAYPFCFLAYFCVLISTLCYDHLRKRNQQTLLMLGELEGLKKFIKTAEIKKLQMLVEGNPRYFFNILPYAYIFNLSDKWIKKFENIVTPDIYSNRENSFNAKEFVYFTKMMNKYTVPSYDNGGLSYSSSGGSSHHSSSGGGGHSGGGGGGGGGRSW